MFAEIRYWPRFPDRVPASTYYLLLTMLFLLITTNVFAQVPLDPSDKTGILDILFVDSFGHPVSGNLVISARQLVGGKLLPAFRLTPAATLKYATYQVNIQASPAYPVDRTVTIHDRYQLLVVALFLAPIEPPWAGNTVNGKLSTHSLEKDCRSIHLASILAGDEHASTKASASGNFVFRNIKPGAYVLVTIGAAGICQVSRIDILNRAVQDLPIQ